MVIIIFSFCLLSNTFRKLARPSPNVLQDIQKKLKTSKMHLDMNKLSPENWMYGMRWREIKHHKGVYKNCFIWDIFYSNLGLENVCVMIGKAKVKGHSEP